MKSGSKVAIGVLLCLLMMALVVAFASCGTVVSGGATTTSVKSATSTVTPTTAYPVTPVSSEKRAAEAYFAAMSPTIEKDYQGYNWFNQAGGDWMETYGESSLSTSLQGWTAILPTFEQALVKEQEILKGYEAVTPSPAFKAAHATLLESNRRAIALFKDVIAGINAKRPPSTLMAMLFADPSQADTEVVPKFNAAAAAIGVSVPEKLLEVYTTDDSSGGTAS